MQPRINPRVMPKEMDRKMVGAPAEKQWEGQPIPHQLVEAPWINNPSPLGIHSTIHTLVLEHESQVCNQSYL